jgi:hypothetical protein
MTNAGQDQHAAGPLTRLWRALMRVVLNKSGNSYGAHLTGGEQYWDEAVGIYRTRPSAPPGMGQQPPAPRM